MAVNIDDSGGWGYDALISGTENTDWARDATNQTFKILTATGSSDTGFTLPTSSAWMLVETYNINGNDAGAVMWRSITLWDGDVDTSTKRNALMTGLRTDMATVISGTTVTSYDAKATYFDGTSTAKVYEADEATAFPDEASPTYTITSYTPPTGTWKVDNTLTAPEEATLATPAWINFGSSGTESEPTGVTSITQHGGYADLTLHTLDDIDGNTSSITFQLITSSWTALSSTGSTSGDDSWCMSDYEAYRYMTLQTAFASRTAELYLPEGTWDVTVTARSETANDNDNYTSLVTLNSMQSQMDACVAHTIDDGFCRTWRLVSSGETFDLDVEVKEYGLYALLNSIRVEEVEADELFTAHINISGEVTTSNGIRKFQKDTNGLFYNTYLKRQSTTTYYPVMNENGVLIPGLEYSDSYWYNDGQVGYGTDGTDTGYINGFMLETCGNVGSSANSIGIKLPTGGTYTVRFAASQTDTNTTTTLECIYDSTTKSMGASYQNLSNGCEWTGLSGSATAHVFTVQNENHPSEPNDSYLSGITITRTA